MSSNTKWTVAFFAASLSVWIFVQFVIAMSSKSLSGISVIVDNPFGLAMLASHLACLSVYVPWSILVGPTSKDNALWTLALLAFGNIALAIRIAVRAVTLPSLDAVMFPVSASETAMLPLTNDTTRATQIKNDDDEINSKSKTSESNTFQVVRILIMVYAAIASLFYAIALVIAWRSRIMYVFSDVIGDPWLLFSFANNITGLLYVSLNIIIRNGKKHPGFAVFEAVAILFVGAYMIPRFLMGVMWPRKSLEDAFLVKRCLIRKVQYVQENENVENVQGSMKSTRIPQ